LVGVELSDLPQRLIQFVARLAGLDLAAVRLNFSRWLRLSQSGSDSRVLRLGIRPFLALVYAFHVGLKKRQTLLHLL
jgi:hypothetical protein